MSTVDQTQGAPLAHAHQDSLPGAPGHADHGHDDHGHHDDGHAHSTFKGYMIGFVLSVVLTAIPFWLVMAHVITDGRVAAIAIMALAAVQVVVHMIYFLHMNSHAEGGWNMLALIFTLMVVGVMLSGSFWVMYNLNANMMPVTASDTRNMP